MFVLCRMHQKGLSYIRSHVNRRRKWRTQMTTHLIEWENHAANLQNKHREVGFFSRKTWLEVSGEARIGRLLRSVSSVRARNVATLGHMIHRKQNESAKAEKKLDVVNESMAQMSWRAFRGRKWVSTHWYSENKNSEKPPCLPSPRAVFRLEMSGI